MKHKNKLDEENETGEDAQSRKERLFSNLVFSYPFLLYSFYWILKTNFSNHSNNQMQVLLYFFIVLPSFLLVFYFKEITFVKVFLMRLKKRYRNELKLSKIDIAGIVVIFYCIVEATIILVNLKFD